MQIEYTRPMKDVVFVTGNPEKAFNFSKHMGTEIPHVAVELDEIQTLDVELLVEHKARQAYEQIGKPVLVEDVIFVCNALGNLPGPFIKFFVAAPTFPESMCRQLDGFLDRSAYVTCTYGYFDGESMYFFSGTLSGKVSMKPRGSNGYGFDRVFEPNGFGGRTAAELSNEEYDKYYSMIKPFLLVKKFLTEG